MQAPKKDELQDAQSLQVRVLGPFNFTLQEQTPLYWLRCGLLEQYLLKARVRTPCPSTVGIVIHSEPDSTGMEGVSFWIERKESGKKYFLAGSDLDTTPVATREFPDSGNEATEDIEILMQGAHGCVFLQERRIRIKFVLRRNKGAVAFYNSSQNEPAEVHWSDVQITNLSRAMPELVGTLAAREKAILMMAPEPLPGVESDVATSVEEKLADQSLIICDEDAPRRVGGTGTFRRSPVKRQPRPKPENRSLKLPLVPSPEQDKRMQRYMPALKTRQDVMRRSASDSALRKSAPRYML